MNAERKPIPGWPGYEASSDGRIWRSVRKGNYLPGECKQSLHKKTGYYKTSLTKDGVSTSLLVHRLVAAAFHGPAEPGQEARHLDGVKRNNFKDNLAWGTPTQNAGDRDRHGSTAAGEAVGTSVLTDEKVRRILARLESRPMAYADIGAQFGVSGTCVGELARGETWKHITGGINRSTGGAAAKLANARPVIDAESSARWDSIAECAAAIGVSDVAVGLAIRRRGRIAGRLIHYAT